MTDKSPSGTGHEPGRPDELSAGTFAGLGIQFALGIILFLYLGEWIDARLGTSPAFLIGGVFLGAAGSFYKIYRRIAAAQKTDDEIRARLRQK
jgi:ATP synthase protein I